MTDSGAKTSFFDQFALGREYKRVYNRVAQPSHPLSIQLVAFWREKEKDGEVPGHGGRVILGRVQWLFF